MNLTAVTLKDSLTKIRSSTSLSELERHRDDLLGREGQYVLALGVASTLRKEIRSTRLNSIYSMMNILRKEYFLQKELLS